MSQASYRTASGLPKPRARTHPLPETPIEAERLAARIESAVWRETGGSVRDLQVLVDRRLVVLTGRCNTYYTKQKAQHAAMGVSDGRSLTNQIDVV
jgi:osmotically-inducible protein OsmY